MKKVSYEELWRSRRVLRCGLRAWNLKAWLTTRLESVLVGLDNKSQGNNFELSMKIATDLVDQF